MSDQRFSICLFCGSRAGNDPAFADAARTLGGRVAERGHKLVYGAGDRGLMGEAARACQSAGGAVMGVIPQHLVDWEVGKTDLDEYVVVQTMHERKKLMFDRSDAVVTLPGGPGTLDELIEVLTWRQLSLHERPVVLVNVRGYWDPLLALLNHVVEAGFADAAFLDYLTVVETPKQAVAEIEARFA